MGGVSMKILSISAILVTLAAAPVSAGLMTNQEGDPIAQCGWKTARLLVIAPENARIFPEDLSGCRDVESETTDESKIDPALHNGVDGSTREESREIATLSTLPISQFTAER